MKDNILLGLVLELIIVMFIAIYLKIDDIPSKVADCTLEIKNDILE